MRFVLPVLLAIAVSACSEPLEFADWTLPVPEDVRVVEYPFTPAEERTESIELVDDLVLGLDANDPAQAFYGVRDVDVDDDGNLWVLDGGNHRIQVFDRDGRFIRSIGREGQGPGELAQPSWLTVVGDRVVVRSDRLRLSVFDLSGNHVHDATFADTSSSVAGAFARPDGALTASYSVYDMSGMTQGYSGSMPMTLHISTFSLEAEELRQSFVLDSEGFVMSSGAEKRPAPVSRPFPSYAASHTGDVYLTTSKEYQVLALDPDAEPKWAMRVAQVPEPLGEELIERAVESARERRPETTRSELIWPERQPALSHIAVDGHGHVYVYPHFERGDELEERPVDVYSSDGELLFSGRILDRRWQRADGDFVFAAGSDRVSGELLVWRWRLVEPF